MRTPPHYGLRAALLTRWHSSMFNFLNAELEAAKTFVSLANRTSSRFACTEYFRHACQAYETVQHFAGRVPLTYRQKTDVQQKLTDLKWNLEVSERAFDASVDDSCIRECPLQLESGQLARDVAKFLAVCERLRAEASEMLKINRQIIKQNEEMFRRLSHPPQNHPSHLLSLVPLVKP